MATRKPKSPAAEVTPVAAPVAEAAPAKKPRAKAAKPAEATTEAKPAAKRASKPKATAPLTPEERYRRIAEAAYFIAEKRGFEPGNHQDDWLQAEAEVNKALGLN